MDERDVRDGHDGSNEDNSYKNKKKIMEDIEDIEDIEDTGQIEEDLKHMVGGAGVPYRVPNRVDAADDVNGNPPGSGNESILSQRLLQILNTNINNIVVDFKQALGNTNQAVNGSVANIVNVLDDLSENINLGIDDANFITRRTVRVRPDGTTIPHDDVDIRNDLGVTFPDYDNQLITNINNNPATVANHHHIVNLNDGIDIPNINNGNPIDIPINNTDEGLQGRIHVQRRLENCIKLEYLYLIKHMELMKIFAFTINLFDKYKYAIKIVLFLLKYLVNKNKEEPDCGSIRLPPPLIPKINDLVRDQAAVQETINLMRTTLDNQNLRDLHQQATAKFGTNPNGTAVGDLTANVPQ